MLTAERFNLIRKEYGYWASWAVWAEEGDTPKSNIGDLAVFDVESNPAVLDELNPNIILVGLNISRGSIKNPLGNFHDRRKEAMDYKIRFALKDTPFWGAYMTDVIKDFNQKESGKVAQYLRKNRSFEKTNIDILMNEINALGVTNPTIVAFGNEAHSILLRNLKDEYQVIKLSHYSAYASKETYRQEVLELSNIFD